MKKILSFVLAVMSVVSVCVFAVAASNNDIDVPADKIFDSQGNRIYYGDVNCDGSITSRDAVLLAQYLAEWSLGSAWSSESSKAADVYHDGNITSRDAVLLAQYLAEWQEAVDTINGLNK